MSDAPLPSSRTTLASRLRHAAETVELDELRIARIIDADPHLVARWWQQDLEPDAEARERLLEVIAVLERLSAVLRPQAAHDWLFTPNSLLDHHKPVDLLQQGEYRRVLGLIDALAEGVFV